MFKIKIFKIIIYMITISFIFTLILSVTGYYESALEKKTTLTNEAIKNFESDIKDGKDIDINNYVSINQKNYDNFFSNTGRKLSSKINNIISKGIDKTLKIILKAIEE